MVQMNYYSINCTGLIFFGDISLVGGRMAGIGIWETKLDIGN